MICPHCGKDTEEKPIRPFDGWIAIPSDDQDEGKAVQWCVARKEFWKQNHHLDDCEPTLEIPEFLNSMESTYEYHGRIKLTQDQQAEKLRLLGFEVLSVMEWAEDE